MIKERRAMMSRTALEVPVSEWKSYRLGPKAMDNRESDPGRWQRAWAFACSLAALLRERYGATRVVAFGSLVQRDWFGSHSDIDLAAWDIPPDRFFRAVAAVTGISAEFEVDLVDPSYCRGSLRGAIEQEGVDL
jgi:predicted nucleotidyltransferase